MNYSTDYSGDDAGSWMDANDVLKKLIGLTVSEIDGAEKGSERVTFTFSNGAKALMFHAQECCETVDLEDISGGINDLIGSPLVEAQESTKSTDPSTNRWSESHTWTFYRFATAKGWVVFRWLGESNGYYSESVDISFTDAPKEQPHD